MTVGINTLFLIPGKVGGTETYTRGLLSALNGIDYKNKHIIFCNKENYSSFSRYSKKNSRVLAPIQATFRPARILWEQIILPFQVLQQKVDVLISMGYICPLFLPCKSIVVIFDLNWFFHPEEFSLLNKLFWKHLVTWSARRADLIITSSENSKRDIINVLKVSPKKVKVVLGGINRNFYKPVRDKKRLEGVKKKYSTGDHFILTVSAAYKFKNLHKLIESFGDVSKKVSDVKLLLVGLGGRGKQETIRRIKELNLEEKVVIAGWVPNEDIPVLYSAADLCVHPSLYEGFGFPVLEAMACGCPVVSSKSASLPELVGKAGIVVDATNKKVLSQGILRVLKNKGLKQMLIKKGLKRSKYFSWENSARNTKKILEVGNI